jgi:hypothetical protein
LSFVTFRYGVFEHRVWTIFEKEIREAWQHSQHGILNPVHSVAFSGPLREPVHYLVHCVKNVQRGIKPAVGKGGLRVEINSHRAKGPDAQVSHHINVQGL